MTNKDDVSHPYDWIDPQAEYWATHGRDVKVTVTGWETATAWRKNTEYDGLEDTRLRDQVANWRLKHDPWCNGRYALAAVVWGLIALVVIGVGAGP